jgi:EAL domain-containing protein (putative c-di-GMP-specific phosphodiesterase class I)
VQLLEIDRSLTRDCVTSVRTRHIVTGVVDLARRLDIVVVDIVMEDEHGAGLVTAFGAQLAQGCLFGRPGPWAAVAARWRAERLDAAGVAGVDGVAAAGG